jgi:hypothetical protein
MRRPRPVVDHGDIITIAGPVDPAGNVYDFVLGLLR